MLFFFVNFQLQSMYELLSDWLNIIKLKKMTKQREKNLYKSLEFFMTKLQYLLDQFFISLFYFSFIIRLFCINIF